MRSFSLWIVAVAIYLHALVGSYAVAACGDLMLKWHMSSCALVCACWLAVATGAASIAPAAASEVNVYSYREEKLIAPLLRAFHVATGIRVNATFASQGLVERVASEGEKSPADILWTTDLGPLLDARRRDLTQAFRSSIVEANVPAIYRDPENHWIGVTLRARVFVVSADRIGTQVVTYEQLAEPQWKGKVCMRSGAHVYNVGLVASMLAHHGAERTESWLRGVAANLARKPAGGDRDQIRAVIAGACDVAVVNSYYVADFIPLDQNLREQKRSPIRVLFPNAADRGTHVSLSGAALLKHGPNRDSSIRLIEFLASEQGQRIFSAVNDEYPVNEGVPPPSLMASWGPLKADPVSLQRIAGLLVDALNLVEKARFDHGPE
jgi:iron(III) transport system substrate-binding protein